MVRGQIREFFWVLAALLVLTAIASAQAAPATACTNASVKGVYGLLITGYDSSNQYQMAVARINSDGKGGFSGTETVSDDGTIFKNIAITGTYSISGNCTGSGTIINPKNGNQAHYNFVVDPLANQVEAAGTDSGHGTASGVAVPLGTATCTNAAVAGTYGFHGGGYIAAKGVWQFNGQYVLDGLGSLTGTETSVTAGNVTSGAVIQGTYKIAANCTGTITYSLNGSPLHLNIVLVGGGQSFFAVDTDTGFVGTLVAHQ